jgi:hypothetical protein
MEHFGKSFSKHGPCAFCIKIMSRDTSKLFEFGYIAIQIPIFHADLLNCSFGFLHTHGVRKGIFEPINDSAP